MVFAKFKKHFGFCLLLCWWWPALDVSRWVAGLQSPLLSPNIWGVMDWLGWSTMVIACFALATRPLIRELPGQNRLADMLSVLRRAAEWLASLALMFVVAAGRAWLFLGTPRLDRLLWKSPLLEHMALRLS